MQELKADDKAYYFKYLAKNIMDKLLTLRYKGSRDYLHGSDFFNALMDINEEITGHSDSFVDRLTFRHYARKMCEITNTKPNDPDKVVGQVRYTVPDDKSHIKFWLVETDNSVADRYPFDETIILDEINLDQEKRSAVLAQRSVYTSIEDVIVLTKHLNYAISPITNGNWLFGQIDLTEPLTDYYQSLEIQMKNLIEGKFSVNDILIDDRQIGTIRFIMGTP